MIQLLFQVLEPAFQYKMCTVNTSSSYVLLYSAHSALRLFGGRLHQVLSLLSF